MTVTKKYYEIIIFNVYKKMSDSDSLMPHNSFIGHLNKDFSVHGED